MMLSVDFDAVIYHRDVKYYIVVPSVALLPVGILDLRFSDLTLQTRIMPTCALMLFEGNLQQLKRYCRYHVIFGRVPRGILKLNNHKILPTNVTQVSVR